MNSIVTLTRVTCLKLQKCHIPSLKMQSPYMHCKICRRRRHENNLVFIHGGWGLLWWICRNPFECGSDDEDDQNWGIGTSLSLSIAQNCIACSNHMCSCAFMCSFAFMCILCSVHLAVCSVLQFAFRCYVACAFMCILCSVHLAVCSVLQFAFMCVM